MHSDAEATIGSGVTIGHNVLWHGRVLADNCLVGNGATVNDGVEVGELFHRRFRGPWCWKACPLSLEPS